MVDVTNVSRNREAPTPTAATWKASRYRLVGDKLWPDYIEATPDAVWSREDPFQYYEPLANRSEANRVLPPHKPFAALSDLARDQHSHRRRPQKQLKLFYDQMRVFGDVYGLLGLFRESIASPVLPERVHSLTSFVAPDAWIDQDGKLRVIDPKTEGKRRLENLLNEHDGSFRSVRLKLLPEALAWPDELRFPTLSVDHGAFGLHKLSFRGHHSLTHSYDDVRERFGIRFVLDRHARNGVSIIATREPLNFWLAELERFWPTPPGPKYFDRVLEDVLPRAVANEEGDLAPSWRCPSLLKALYLMLYLDHVVASVRLLKCQAPNCPDYYRAGPLSRDSRYCPPPPGKKQSKCASRAASAMYRERQRKSRNSDTA